MGIFKKWLEEIELNELGTGTNCVAVVPTRLFSGPIRRKKVKRIATEGLAPMVDITKKGEGGFFNNNQSSGEPLNTAPTGDQFNINFYPGQYPGLFAKTLEQYNKTKDKNLEIVLQKAQNGDDDPMKGLVYER